MLTVGLEKEYFLVNEDCCAEQQEPVVIPTDSHLSYDDCGWLIEARGKPYHDVTEAIFSLLADESRIKDTLAIYNRRRTESYALSFANTMTVSKAIRIKALRTYQKGLIKYQNLYGHEHHAHKGDDCGAGVHISFTHPREITLEKGSTIVNQNFDWARLFLGLDEAFKDEIKAAHRLPGFYELKYDGRIEYRSLPSDIDLHRVKEVLEGLIARII